MKAGKREGGPGTDGGPHKGTSSSVSNPSRNGKTLGAENDATRASWPSGTLICQKLRQPPSFSSSFQGLLLAAQIPSKESRSLASQGVAAAGKAKFWKLWDLKAEGGDSLNLSWKAGPGPILCFWKPLE